MRPNQLDVICIGFGWSGILAVKQCLEQGLSVIALEKREVGGGVWAFSGDPSIPTVMKSTHTSSSRYVTEMSDYPMPDHFPHFPSHRDIKGYLDAYCDTFDLHTHVSFDTTCIRVWKEDDLWVVETNKGTWIGRHLIVASGLHQFPSQTLANSTFANFEGELTHAAEYKSPEGIDPSEKVLVVGGGETACDIAAELSLRSPGIYQSIPNGQWIIRKHQESAPMGFKDVVFDTVTSHFMDTISPITKYSHGQTEMGEMIYGKNFHGIEEWTTERPPDRGFITKIGERFLDTYIPNGQIIPKRRAVRCKGKIVTFEDGSEVEVDRVILATGFETKLPYFKGELAKPDIQSMYKYIFYNPDPTLAFVGFVRPQIGSIPVIAEMASRLIAQTWSGKVTLPGREERVAVTARDKAFWNDHYRHTSLRIKGLVEQRTYLDQLADLMGSKPQFWDLFWSRPRAWLTLLFSPLFSSAQYLVNDEEHGPIVLERLRNRIRPNHILIPFFVLPAVPIGSLYRRFVLWQDERKRNRILNDEPIIQIDPDPLIE